MLGFVVSVLGFVVFVLGFMVPVLGFLVSVLGFVVSVLGLVVFALGFVIFLVYWDWASRFSAYLRGFGVKSPKPSTGGSHKHLKTRGKAKNDPQSGPGQPVKHE